MDDSFVDSSQEGTYLLITNIPQVFHSKDLRNYFSHFIDKNAFLVFHYRHRPEDTVIEYLKTIKESAHSSLECLNSEASNIPEKIINSETTAASRLSEGIRNLSEVIWVSKNAAECKGETDYNNSKKVSFPSDYALSRETESLSLSQQRKEQVIMEEEKLARCCCLILITNEYLDSFKALYNRKFWVNGDGVILPIRCLIFDLTLILKLNEALLTSKKNTGCDVEVPYSTRSEQLLQRKKIAFEKMTKLIEFDTPLFMPQGNVGTPNSYFRSLLDQCKLPTSIISKLGLDFYKRKCKKKYSQVHLDYGTEIKAGGVHPDPYEAIFTENGDLIPGYFDIKFNKSLQKRKKSSQPILELEREEEDGAEIEEWERFEAFHNDVTKQERAKERLFESEIELVWEKGGSGLVFYTDAQFWRAYEGGEEERETDEWDVDVTPYYESGGDLDARASLSMVEMDHLRSGKISSSVFSSSDEHAKKEGKLAPFRREAEMMIMRRNKNAFECRSSKVKSRRERQKEKDERSEWRKSGRNGGDSKEHAKRGPWSGIGNFERHTKGIGRRLLEAQGWTEGEGLGREKKGMAQALGSPGKHPLDKSGFGYNEKRKENSEPKQRFISTAFDSPETIDPMPPPNRSSEPSTLSHRSFPYNINFRRSKNEN